MWALPAAAQAPAAPAPGAAPLEQIERPAERRRPLPELEPEPVRPGLVLPPVAAPPLPAARPRAGPRVFVREIVVSGNTVFTDRELATVTAPYTGRDIATAELEELRRTLTLLYVDRGYVNSGAVIPDQAVDDGVVHIRIVEGRLSQVSVSGNERLRAEYITRRVARGAGPPLNVDDLDEQLRILLQDPLIDGLEARLGPGPGPGESELQLDVERSPAVALGVRVANDRSPTIGPVRGEIAGVARNLTGWGDALALEVGRSAGLGDGAASFSQPLNPLGTTLRLSLEKNRADVVEEPFDDIDIESRSESLEVGLRHPFYRTPTRELALGLALSRRHGETSLLGRPFSFSPGVVDGESDVAVLRLSQEWSERWARQAIAARSVISVGVDALGATVNDSGPDGRFVSWLGQARLTQRVGLDIGYGESQLILRGEAQYTRDALLPLEKFAVGGAYSVRGYRENLLVRDKGVVVSLEGRLPVYRLAIPGLSGADDGIVQLAAFADYGRAWNEAGPNPEVKKIYSVGFGISWSPTRKFHARLYVGTALRDVPIPDDSDLQDSGIHFEIAAQLF